jgi:glycosyltransferase involved in cell wall biosynthesis
MMRILVLTPTFMPMVGGAEIVLLEVYRRLAERHEVCLLTVDKGLPPSDLDHLINFQVVRYRDRFSFMKFRGHRLTGGIVPPFSLSAVSATRRTVADFRPDVLNTHYMAPTGLATVVVQRQFSLPCVLSFTGRDVPGPNTPWFWKYYGRWVARQVADVTYISGYCRRAIFGPTASLDGHIIPAGVNLQRYHPHISAITMRQRLGLSPDVPVLLAVQRLSPEKRVDIIIQAMSYVLREHPQAILVIGGAGKSQPKLVSLVQQLGLEQSVRFIGYIPDADLPLYYAMCDIFVFHSTYETFGIVLAEAMAVGKAIVSVNSTAIPEVISDGKTGVLVPPLNALAMADRINHLLDTPSECARLGSNARTWAEQHFDWNLIAGRYEAVLETVNR